jgi:hypothetical protein
MVSLPQSGRQMECKSMSAKTPMTETEVWVYVGTASGDRRDVGNYRKMSMQNDKSQMTMIEDAVDAGIEAAAEAVSTMGIGQKAWGSKEFEIARTAAREAIAALRQMEAGK